MRALAAALTVVVCLGVLGYFVVVAWDALHRAPSDERVASARTKAVELIARQAKRDRAGSPSPTTQPVPPGAVGDEEPPPSPADEQRPLEVGDGVRFIDRDGIVGVRVDGPLERAPSTVTLAPPPPEPEAPPTSLYRLVVIEAAGLIDARSHKIKLAHVEAPAASLTCTRADGEVWPCGMRARTAMRRLIRRRAIECLRADDDADAPQDPKTDAAGGGLVVTECSVANTDLSRWLVEQGWAAPSASAPESWAELHDFAKIAKRGLYDTDAR
ncbi:MAG: hypothetical protein AAGJ94_10815 [Pseudomonadota bacterium]